MPSTFYFGRLDGRDTMAVFISRRRDLRDSSLTYLLARPVLDSETERVTMVRALNEGLESKKLRVQICAVKSLSMLRRVPDANRSYLNWGTVEATADYIVPKFCDLEAVAQDPKFLPINAERAAIQLTDTDEEPMSEAHRLAAMLLGAADEEEPEPKELAGGEEARPRAAPAPPGPSPFGAAPGGGPRLPSGGPPTRPPLYPFPTPLEYQPLPGVQAPARSVFGASMGTPTEADMEFLRSVAARAPAPPYASVPPSEVPSADAAPPVPSGGSHLEQMLFQLLQKTMVRETQRDGPSAAQAGLFKMHGARGRVAQDELDRTFDADPDSVIRGFEEAVMRRASGTAASQYHMSGPGAAHVLLPTWRETVPAKGYPLVARVGEAIIDAYRHLRSGRTQHGTARLALLIGALEQCILDDGKWVHRAEHLLGLPPAPMQVYQQPEALRKHQVLGPMARLADPLRATTALAVYKDFNPDHKE